MLRSSAKRAAQGTTPRLEGRRIVLRPLDLSDFSEWQRVRRTNVDWLTKWEPRKTPGHPDTVENREAFRARCAARARERQLGTGFGFGVFVGRALVGEMNINSVQRGPFQSCYVGYWVDQEQAGNSYTPEALVCVLRFAFEELHLHRVQIAIIPRNTASRRVVEKLDLRSEGVAERYLEIDGIWEDHMRFAITTEEWDTRGPDLMRAWL